MTTELINRSEPQTDQQDELMKVAKKLELTIQAQYSELDLLSNSLSQIQEGTHIYAETYNEYRNAGITFRASIVFAFGILEQHKSPRDKQLYNEWKNKLGNQPFKNLNEAKDFRDTTTKLLFNMQEYTDSILDELEIGGI